MGQQATNVRSEVLQWEPVFTELTRLRPTDGDLWLQRARSLNQKGKWADALAAYTKAVETQPEDIAFLWERANLLVQEQQWDAANADYLKALDLTANPNVANWKPNIVSAFSQNEKLLGKALELRPDNLDLLLIRAAIRAGRNEVEPALRDYSSVLAKDPERNGVRLDRGRFYIRLGRWAEAEADFASALGDGTLIDDWFQLACLHLLAGHTDEFKDHCRKTIKLHGKSREPDVDFHGGRILSLTVQDDQTRAHASKWAERVVATVPTIAWYLHSLGLAHFRAGEYDRAIERLKESRKNSPDWGGPHNALLLAMCYQTLNQPEAAFAERHLVDEWLNKINLGRPQAEWELAPAGFSLSDWLEYQLLRREAEKLFQNTMP
jgi:tetratricopeptide (TPR) repeat protein